VISARLVTPRPENREFSRRLRVMAWACSIAFLVLLGRLWQLQILQGDLYHRKSEDNFVRDVEIPALRGLIRDRKGQVLADNRPAYNVYVTPKFLSDEALNLLAECLQLTPERRDAIRERVKSAKGIARFRPFLAVEDVSREQMARVATNRQNLPGVQIATMPRRVYPLGATAGHVTGYLNEITAAELQTRRNQGYRPGDVIGRWGLERQWEGYLRGTPGFERIIVDARGQRKSEEETRELLKVPRREDPVPGNTVVTTLDADLQRLAERALRRYPSGAAVVVEVRTGRLLAMVSRPAFDPNVMSGRLTAAQEAELNENPYRPRIDKTVRENYYPGSTYKVIPALAGLQAGLISPNERVTCRGYHELGRRLFRCSKVHKQVNLYEALAQSCNVYFYKLAERVGMDRMAEVAREFGLGEPTGLGLNGEVAGFIPTQAWYKQHALGGFRIGYTLNAAIGQGATKVTVLQLAMLYAAIANGGELHLPMLVDRIETPSGNLIQGFEPRLRRRVNVNPRHLETVKRALEGVTKEKGTAYEARLKDIEVSGKTGTAQVRRMGRSRQEGSTLFGLGDHAWFVGFAPSRQPEIAVVVLVEHGGLGGHVAAPIAMEIIRGYFERIAPHKQGAPAPGSQRTQPARDALQDLPAPSLDTLKTPRAKSREH